jgi:hypothetical protein
MDEFQQVMFEKRDSIIREIREFPLTKWAYSIHNINFPKEPIRPLKRLSPGRPRKNVVR